ncbi:MAG: hypothetical protein LBJ12_02650 [Oscillospiraceae bacterium]|jgi:hypothetical protein|nr:hypothetical protein [Oscillospiraceae bacterium]
MKKHKIIVIIISAILILTVLISPIYYTAWLDFEVEDSIYDFKKDHDSFTFKDIGSFKWDKAYMGNNLPKKADGTPYECRFQKFDWRKKVFSGGAGSDAIFIFFIRNDYIIKRDVIFHMGRTCADLWITPDTEFVYIEPGDGFFEPNNSS